MGACDCLLNTSCFDFKIKQKHYSYKLVNIPVAIVLEFLVFALAVENM